MKYFVVYTKDGKIFNFDILRKAIEEYEKNHFKDNQRKSLMKRDSKYGKN